MTARPPGAGLLAAFALSSFAVRQARAQEAGPAELPVTVTLKDGLQFRSSDGEFQATLGGYVGVHYRWFADRPDDPLRASQDTFFIRQARPEFSGTLRRDWEFRVQLDFPTGTASSTTGTLQDGYLGWKRWPEFSLRFGQVKEPFGQEFGTPDRRVELCERSVVERLSPGRDLGLLAYGRLAGGVFSYEAAVFNGQGRGATDGNDEKDAALRLRVTPFARDEEGSLLKGLRLGLAGTLGDVDDAPSSGLDLSTSELGILFLDASAGTLDGLRSRVGAELTWNLGPSSFRTEWIRRRDEVDVGALDGEPIETTGWTAMATWIVTGESKPIEGQVSPADPFDPAAGSLGAVELTLRVARLEVDDALFAAGIAPAAGNSGGVTTWTAGLNWFLHRNVRIAPNFIFERFDDSIDFADGKSEDRFFGGILRVQVEF